MSEREHVDDFNPVQPRDTYRREVEHPADSDRPERERRVVGWVELRPLNVGDVAEIDAMHLELGEQVLGFSMTTRKLAAVERALVAWSFAHPITSDVLRQLNPQILEQIWRHVDMGGGESQEPAQGADGAGPLRAASEHSTEGAVASS